MTLALARPAYRWLSYDAKLSPLSAILPFCACRMLFVLNAPAIAIQDVIHFSSLLSYVNSVPACLNVRNFQQRVTDVLLFNMLVCAVFMSLLSSGMKLCGLGLR